MDMEPGRIYGGIQTRCDNKDTVRGRGVDAVSRQKYHCWITDRTIPLDELWRYKDINRRRCSVAAFHCMLKAAQLGLYLSDNNFFNFGLLVTEDATEHHVVIIDAGSMGIGRETLRKNSGREHHSHEEVLEALQGGVSNEP